VYKPTRPGSGSDLSLVLTTSRGITRTENILVEAIDPTEAPVEECDNLHFLE